MEFKVPSGVENLTSVEDYLNDILPTLRQREFTKKIILTFWRYSKDKGYRVQTNLVFNYEDDTLEGNYPRDFEQAKEYNPKTYIDPLKFIPLMTPNMFADVTPLIMSRIC